MATHIVVPKQYHEAAAEALIHGNMPPWARVSRGLVELWTIHPGTPELSQVSYRRHIEDLMGRGAPILIIEHEIIVQAILGHEHKGERTLDIGDEALRLLILIINWCNSLCNSEIGTNPQLQKLIWQHKLHGNTQAKSAWTTIETIVAVLVQTCNNMIPTSEALFQEAKQRIQDCNIMWSENQWCCGVETAWIDWSFIIFGTQPVNEQRKGWLVAALPE